MAGGRPTLYTEDIVNIYETTQSFINEKELCDFLEYNIELFCSEHLRENYESHEREAIVTKQIAFKTGRGKRVDFCVSTKEGKKIAIECKTGKYAIGAIGQLLGYSLHKNYDRLVIISSKYDPILKKVIEKYKLPIDLFFFKKDYTLSYQE